MRTVSACILSYNRAEFLCAALESVLEQTLQPTEILIFDNGSDAQVLEKVQPYLKQGVQWVGAEVNQSAIWNFRRAVKTASSEFLFVLHDDDRLCPEFVQRQKEFLETHPEVGAVTCNGYLIDKHGKRNGRVLRPEFTRGNAEFYNNAAEVAMRYASDGCLPFSPVMYRAAFARSVELRDDYGKVVDAVFFCDLAQTGVLAYQPTPLYECRIHETQDSSYFPDAELERLADYFESQAQASPLQRKELQHLLVRQHTSRQLRKIAHALQNPLQPGQLLQALGKLQHPRFSFSAALRILASSLAKRCGRRTH